MDTLDPELRYRINSLRWVLPIAFALGAVLYQLGPAHWVSEQFGDSLHFGVEIFFYATVAPIVSFWILTKIKQWLEENEQVQKQIRANESLLASIMSASADAILGLDVAGKVETWSLGAKHLLGYSENAIVNQPFSLLFGHQAATKVELDWLLEHIRMNGFIHNHETTCIAVNGQPIDVTLTATQLTDSQGHLFGTSVILHDITERKQREREILELNTSLSKQVAARTSELAEKIEALARANTELQKLDQTRTEFVSLVSHQIRAPLTNMNGAVQRMQSGCHQVNSNCARMFPVLQQQTARLDRLVQDVLNASRLESSELDIHSEPISIQPIAKQVVNQIRARAIGRSVMLPHKPGLPFAFADRDRVAEVLTNLIDNADKYSPPDEAITVDIRANETTITISVQDRGPGLPPTDLETIFEKFYRTDSSDAQVAYGYGLGLYVCRKLVEAQNGRIWAENAPNGGAIFSFSLPVWQDDYD
jgi:PAS domain S-box-containing protein